MEEPLLISDDSRYVMFPIQYQDLWNMYKKHVDCFWRAEEIDLSRDMTHWNSLNSDEKHFSSKLVQPAVGWAASLGYKTNIKPHNQIATKAADHHCR